MMYQLKKKEKKEEVSQPSIRCFIMTTDIKSSENIVDEHWTTPRSKSTKRKIPPSPSSNEKLKDCDRKRPFSRAHSPTDMEDIPEQNIPLTLEAVQHLLQPLDERLNEVLTNQKEMRDTIGEVATLKEENEKLKQ